MERLSRDSLIDLKYRLVEELNSTPSIEMTADYLKGTDDTLKWVIEEIDERLGYAEN